MTSRKRKADEDGDEMSVSPMNSPAISNRPLSRPTKKARAVEVTGRPLSLPRLLETLDSTQLRTVLRAICERLGSYGVGALLRGSAFGLVLESIDEVGDASPG